MLCYSTINYVTNNSQGNKHFYKAHLFTNTQLFQHTETYVLDDSEIDAFNKYYENYF